MQKIWWQDCSPKCFVTFIEDSGKLKETSEWNQGFRLWFEHLPTLQRNRVLLSASDIFYSATFILGFPLWSWSKISIFHHQFMLTTGLPASVVKSSLKFVMSVSVCINILQFCSIAATCEMAFKISLPLLWKQSRRN